MPGFRLLLLTLLILCALAAVLTARRDTLAQCGFQCHEPVAWREDAKNWNWERYGIADPETKELYSGCFRSYYINGGQGGSMDGRATAYKKRFASTANCSAECPHATKMYEMECDGNTIGEEIEFSGKLECDGI